MADERRGLTRKDFLRSSAAGLAVAGATACTTAPQKLGAGSRDVKWGFLIDLDRCIGCKACAIACKAEFDTRLGVFRSQVIYHDHGEYPDAERDFLPWLCNHCDNPPCVEVCPVEPIEATFDGIKFEKKATYKRPDGAVLVDQDRCIGCGLCIQNCPYRVRFFDPGKKAGGDPEEHPAAKCTLCEHRLAADLVPSCVNTCQARARLVGNLNDPQSEISKILRSRETEVLLPQRGTKPQVYYVGKNRSRINEALDKGEDLRREADSEYQLKVWKDGPYA